MALGDLLSQAAGGIAGLSAQLINPFGEALGLGQQTQTNVNQVNMPGAGQAEQQLFQQLMQRTGTVPSAPNLNTQLFQQSLGAGQNVANQFLGFEAGSVLPTQQQQGFAQQTAQSIFAPQRQQLKQQFRQQTTEANRLAARLGRSVNDPILQSRLRTAQTQQQGQLGAQQTAFAGQLAMELPQRELSRQLQQLQTRASGAQLLGGLAGQQQQVMLKQFGLTQAKESQEYNRKLQLFQLERNLRLASAGRTSTGNVQESPFASMLTLAGGALGAAGKAKSGGLF